MTKLLIHAEAITLRKNGLSIGLIAKRLGVSKGTVSFWCRDIALTEKQIKLIAQNSKHQATLALLKAAEIQRKRRKENIEEMTLLGKRDVGTFTKRDLLMVGLGLYWGEGYKKGNQELGFTNSDPRMIQFYIKWLQHIFVINTEQLTLRVSINSQHKHSIESIHAFWSQCTNIPLTQFTKPSFIKSKAKKQYPATEVHYGTLRIKVKRGTQTRRRILGAIGALPIK